MHKLVVVALLAGLALTGCNDKKDSPSAPAPSGAPGLPSGAPPLPTGAPPLPTDVPTVQGTP